MKENIQKLQEETKQLEQELKELKSPQMQCFVALQIDVNNLKISRYQYSNETLKNNYPSWYMGLKHRIYDNAVFILKIVLFEDGKLPESMASYLSSFAQELIDRLWDSCDLAGFYAAGEEKKEELLAMKKNEFLFQAMFEDMFHKKLQEMQNQAKRESENDLHLESDLQKLRADLQKLQNNRAKVPEQVLKTKYYTAYCALKQRIYDTSAAILQQKLSGQERNFSYYQDRLWQTCNLNEFLNMIQVEKQRIAVC